MALRRRLKFTVVLKQESSLFRWLLPCLLDLYLSLQPVGAVASSPAMKAVTTLDCRKPNVFFVGKNFIM
jgi:hypothetical protein